MNAEQRSAQYVIPVILGVIASAVATMVFRSIDFNLDTKFKITCVVIAGIAVFRLVQYILGRQAEKWSDEG